MPSQQYQALLAEEKLDEGRTIQQTRKWSKTRIALSFSLLVLLSAIIALTTQASTRQIPTAKTSFEDEGDEWLREHLTRATGSTYLIGVGKADITGFVEILDGIM